MKNIVLFASVLRIALISLIIGFAIYANAQSVALNTTGNSADASAMLDVSSTSKGFLPPRMTTIQRAGIPSPANGLIVFDTDTKSYWYFSEIWKEITNAGGGAFALPYSGSSSSPTKVFSIHNTGVTNGSSAIYGRSGDNPSGIVPPTTAAICGDNYFADGILGTSHLNYGVAGISGLDYGVYGKSLGATAGVYGTSTDSNGIGVRGEVGNGGLAMLGINNGEQGGAARFYINNSNSPGTALHAFTYGIGHALNAAIANVNSTQSAAVISTNGLGRAVNITSSNPANNDYAVFIGSQGNDQALHVSLSNASSNAYVIEGVNSGLGGGLSLLLPNANATGTGIHVSNNGSGTGIYAKSNKGAAAWFVNENAANTETVLTVSTNGTGSGLVVSNTNVNTVSSLATFRKGGFNRARIDGTGKGFFNGGTQNSGADLAEAFDVDDDINNYEAGDVLVISTQKDRSVVKSNGAYSTLVAGVYATKPGVLLTEEDIETDISDKVPMGVVGVIPTKVCLEGGEIKRGDLLVTSSIPGVAMKADIEKVKPGQVIGKALENFNSSSTGKIKVLVNAK